jgi:hypothetical protein
MLVMCDLHVHDDDVMTTTQTCKPTRSCPRRLQGPWIVKPAALSRGRGIFLLNNLSQLPAGEASVVCRYINNPLLVNGYKFDLRIYVMVTGFDPLRIYMFREGLARFATEPFSTSPKDTSNPFIHLTNYSVNKSNDKFVKPQTASQDNVGSKWSMSALFRYLESQGQNVDQLIVDIQDVVVKAILSCEGAVVTACHQHVPYDNNCFELFGFDILVDEKLRPWLLEVNLSPSLACEAPLDLKIKSQLVSDVLNMACVPIVDPLSQMDAFQRRRLSLATHARLGKMNTYLGRRALSASVLLNARAAVVQASAAGSAGVALPATPLTTAEKQILGRLRLEHERAGGFRRLFPTADSWDRYHSFMDNRTRAFNMLMHRELFPSHWHGVVTAAQAASLRPATGGMARAGSSYRRESVAAATHDRVGAFIEQLPDRPIQTHEHLRDALVCIGSLLKKRLRPWDAEQLPEFGIVDCAPAIVETSDHEEEVQHDDLDDDDSDPSRQGDGGRGIEGARQPVRDPTSTSDSYSNQDVTGDSVSDDDEASRGSSRKRTDGMNTKSNAGAADGRGPASLSVRHRLPQEKVMQNSVRARMASSLYGGPYLAAQQAQRRHRVVLAPPGEPAGDQESSSVHMEPAVVGRHAEEQLGRVGKQLTALQARRVFSAYLERIHTRLEAYIERATSGRRNVDEDATEQENQLEVVTRFLQRALTARPSSGGIGSRATDRRVALVERQKLLAGALVSFMGAYREETLRQQRSDGGSGGAAAEEAVAESVLRSMLESLPEESLEALLSAYMEHHGSARVFLHAAPPAATGPGRIRGLSAGTVRAYRTVPRPK